MKNIHLETQIVRTPRVMQLEGMFDLAVSENAITEIPLNIPDLNEKEWNIGLIVGPSGAGKTSTAKAMFGQELKMIEEFVWSKNKAVIDDFDSSLPIKEVTELLSSVGFSSPPAWLRPFHTLSNGEQFRVTMARVLSETKDEKIAVVDEFTSVIDRTVAKIGSHAIAKAVRRRNQKFVAVGCHYDVQEWLQPDWIYEPATGSFRWEYLRQRPQIQLQVFRANYEAWRTFSKHHYLSADLNKSAHLYVCTIENQPAAMIAILPLVHGKIKNAKRISRIVVLPDFQGINLANHFQNLLCANLKMQGFDTHVTTSHPAYIRSLNKSPNWVMTRKPSRVPTGATKNKGLASSGARVTVGFKYVGPSDNRLQQVLAPKVNNASR